MNATRLIIGAMLAVAPLLAAADEPATVMVVGTYHMANPGRDFHNVEAVDVLAPEKQAELERIVEALAKFEPTLVAVEWPEEIVNERYAKYLRGELEPARNEVVQLGFRLAKRVGLDRVHGIDADGNFPYGPVQAWAEKHGRAGELAAMSDAIGKYVAKVTELQRESIAKALRYMNAPETVARDQGFYMSFLTYGKGKEQPGADLLEAWAGRNYRICAQLLQSIRPGDRAIVIYGAGHAYYLQRCARDAPNVRLVEANDYLPAD